MRGTLACAKIRFFVGQKVSQMMRTVLANHGKCLCSTKKSSRRSGSKSFWVSLEKADLEILKTLVIYIIVPSNFSYIWHAMILLSNFPEFAVLSKPFSYWGSIFSFVASNTISDFLWGARACLFFWVKAKKSSRAFYGKRFVASSRRRGKNSQTFPFQWSVYF